jgi:transposase InsO family protein
MIHFTLRSKKMPYLYPRYKIPEIRSKKCIIDHMVSKYEQQLNPRRYKLSTEAKQKLKWIYELENTHHCNISKASRRLMMTREWLSKIYSRFQEANRNPLSLEPRSRAPISRLRRLRISSEIEDLIIQIRTTHSVWGKEKISYYLNSEHQVKTSSSTVGRYLKKHRLIDLRISKRNSRAWKNKTILSKIRARPPKQIKDYKPGALVEKDMKFIVKQGIFNNTDKYKSKENYYYQHTMIDSFTRMRFIDLVRDSSSSTAASSFKEAIKRSPFTFACINEDNGSENHGKMEEELANRKIKIFYSNVATPTDNPRVERSHRTDEDEFYAVKGNRFKSYSNLKIAQREWEYIYNYKRPHQALGYLTPNQFYHLWKKDPAQAYKITESWQRYLNKQSKRLQTSRRIKKREEINALMEYIDRKVKHRLIN